MKAVWLTSNGDYWQAKWTGGSKGLGSKAKVSRRAAMAKCRNLAAKLDERAAGIAPRLTEWLKSYRDERSDVAKATTDGYRYTADLLAKFFTDDPRLSGITRQEAASWREWLRTQDRIRSEFTVVRHVRTARQMFREAVAQELIRDNPFDRLKAAQPKVRKEWANVTLADLRKILEACPSDGWRLLFALCRMAGLRRGEAIRLRWPDVDLDRNRMTINSTGRQTTKVRVRIVPIEPARCPTGLAALLRKHKRDNGLVCQVGRNNLRRDAIAIVERAGIAVYAKPMHTLRKCREVELAQVYPAYVVSEWQGHDVQVSLDHYLRVPEELYEAKIVSGIVSGDMQNGAQANVGPM